MVDEIYPGFDESLQSIMIEKDLPEFKHTLKEVGLQNFL